MLGPNARTQEYGTFIYFHLFFTLIIHFRPVTKRVMLRALSTSSLFLGARESWKIVLTGQHLLRNPGIVDKILNAAELKPSDVAFEIGPGTGRSGE